MQDNLSLVVTIIVLVALIVIFPLYNLFERQDNMSYNLVLKATTNFVDEVKNNGYIDNTMYDNFVKQLANTGNIYNIEIEAHKKILVLDESTTDDTSDYIEKYKIDYNDDIFEPLDTNANPGVSTNITTDRRILKNSTYLLNKDDQIYVKVKNYSQTMAQVIFKIISPTTDKSKIAINYGGVIANNSWKQVDSTFFAHNTRPTITLTANPDVINNNSVNPDTSITFTATSTVSSWWKHIVKYVYTIAYTDIATGIKETFEVESTNGILTRNFPQGIYSVTVYSVDSDGEVSKTVGTGFVALQNFMQQAIGGVGLAQVESIEISGATISEYTFEVRVRPGHSGSDWWRVTGLTTTGTWENVNPINVANPTVYSSTIKNNVSNGVTTGVKVLPDPNRYVKLKFEYYVEPGHEHCLNENPYIKYSVKYKFE